MKWVMLRMEERIESIVKYNGDIRALADSMGLAVDVLNESYAIMVLSPEERRILSQNPQIEYIEEQRILSFLYNPAITSACITAVQQERGDLTGRGILIATLDSGIDYVHNDFRNSDGTTRILRIWDQNAIGTPPAGFTGGAEYTEEDINAALNGSATENIPVRDQVGHGTAVAGVAAGNGRASAANYLGGAPEASLLIVRLAQNVSAYFTSDTNLMRGIKYAIDVATALNMPLVINISYGTNQGSHDGSSLFEQYINDMADRWKTAIVIPTGNEGVSGKHYYGRVSTGGTINAQFTVQSRLERLNITMLKSFVDEMQVQIVDGSGRTSSTFDLRSDQVITLGAVQVVVSILQPTPYNADQNVTIIFSDLSGQTLISTIWSIRIIGVSIVNGSVNMWLPVTEISGANTSFLNPQVNTSLTIPSTVPKVISVGGYNSTTNTLATFSGRGFTISGVVKPEICAPAVNVVSTAIGGGYSSFTGTSFAAPITAAACAIMMQWGIVQGNDIYMYGQRLKAFLEYGAVQHVSYLDFPNPAWGYGALCLKNSLDYAREYAYANPLFVSGNAPNVVPAVNSIGESEFPAPELLTDFNDPSNPQNGNINNFDLMFDMNNLNGVDAINPALDESYLNFIIQYNPVTLNILSQVPEIVISSVVRGSFGVVHIPVENEAEYESLVGRASNIVEHSILYGLMQNPALDAAGITAVKLQPNLRLTGRGALIGIVDTGIDYTLDTFRYEDGRSKIVNIWDQTIQSGTPPQGYIYGTEYDNTQINEALASDAPRALVPSTDEIGHGTFLSSLMAGRRTAQSEEGAAPDAELVVVKLKQAKQASRNFSGITDNVNAYESVDIMNGLDYLVDVAQRLERPIVICIGLGSSDGAHDGNSFLEQYLASLANINRVIAVTAVGNEGDRGHHAAGMLLEADDMEEIEFSVSDETSGFFLVVWGFTPDRLSVSITTPLGGVVDRRKFMTNERVSYSFVLERSQIVIDYIYPSFKNGSQFIFIRILNPQQGLWRLRVHGDLIIDGRFNVWLPVSTLWNNAGFFLEPQVDTTAALPATAWNVLSTGAFNSLNGTIYASSGRGPSVLGKQCPDFVAPGVNVSGVIPGGANSIMTGTSVAAAITAGACALVLQWAVTEGNDISINTTRMGSYLLIGLNQRPGIVYPDNLWGYGELNLYNSFSFI